MTHVVQQWMKNIKPFGNGTSFEKFECAFVYKAMIIIMTKNVNKKAIFNDFFQKLIVGSAKKYKLVSHKKA